MSREDNEAKWQQHKAAQEEAEKLVLRKHEEALEALRVQEKKRADAALEAAQQRKLELHTSLQQLAKEQADKVAYIQAQREGEYREIVAGREKKAKAAEQARLDNLSKAAEVVKKQCEERKEEHEHEMQARDELEAQVRVKARAEALAAWEAPRTASWRCTCCGRARRSWP